MASFIKRDLEEKCYLIDNEYNLAICERRADAVKKYLTSPGVSAGRITTISYGEERPVALGHNEAAWSQNRRDEFKLIK